MSSLRHKAVSAEDAYLDAARDAILAVGWSRTTLTDIARRAGVSRMSIYRRWPDMGALVADLMTREWSALLYVAASGGDELDRIIDSVLGTVAAIRDNELFHRILELDPDVVLPYLLERSGRSQELVVELLASQVRAGQAAGVIRLGPAEPLARSVVLAAHGFVLSAHTMGDPADFDAELARMLRGYLAA
ncbi:MAG TPA: TetR/AcrR family transcriptional regulator [Marmoricola sp.]|jgi:AcrR family transcriptional regulator|nr:TetR/AcrR family transcriptional regulator [Marmoricola sp.]